MIEPPWTDLGDGISVRQSRVYWMNTVVLGSPEHTVIVDPGVLPSELDDLERQVPEIGAAAITLVFTHGDWDHVLGRPWWPKAATVAHARFADDVRANRDRIVREAEKSANTEAETWKRPFTPFQPDEAVAGLRFTRMGPWRLVFRDAFGHSPSMLTLHLPEQGVLIAADLLSDLEIPMIKDSWQAYRETLAELEPLARNGAIETIIPGHGAITRDPEEVIRRIERDLGYLEALEREVGAARTRGLSVEDTQAALASMDYLGKDAAYAMNDVHAKNVAVVHREPVVKKAAKPARKRPDPGFSENGS